MSNPPAFTNDDVEEILRIVDQLADVDVKFETADFKLHVRKGLGAAPASVDSTAFVQQKSVVLEPAPAAVSAPAQETKTAIPVSAPPKAEAGTIAIRAPMLGRFYRAPSPTEPAYVEIGTRVGPEDPVCMIEVMKLFKTVNAGVSGTIVSIAVNDGDMIEDDQPLFFVKAD